jgi:hypothetical protein
LKYSLRYSGFEATIKDLEESLDQTETKNLTQQNKEILSIFNQTLTTLTTGLNSTKFKMESLRSSLSAIKKSLQPLQDLQDWQAQVDAKLSKIPTSEDIKQSYETIGTYGSFLIYPGTKTYGGGQTACASTGGHVVEFTKANFNDKLDQIVAKYGEILNGGMFVGLTDKDREDTWKWARSGAILDFYPWNDGEPNNVNNEDCATLSLDSLKFNDLDCNHVQHIVCEQN